MIGEVIKAGSNLPPYLLIIFLLNMSIIVGAGLTIKQLLKIIREQGKEINENSKHLSAIGESLHTLVSAAISGRRKNE